MLGEVVTCVENELNTAVALNSSEYYIVQCQSINVFSNKTHTDHCFIIKVIQISALLLRRIYIYIYEYMF